MEPNDCVDKYIEEFSYLLQWLKGEKEKLAVCAGRIIRALKEGGKLILFGCGGSAGDAQHVSAELVGRFKRERPPLPAIALTTNTSILTAISNDYSFDEVFSRQVDALTTDKDVVIAISTSGRSRSVIKGAKAAREKKAFTIALTGGDGGLLAGEADIAFVVPSSNTPLVQSAHLFIGHLLCEMIDQAFEEEK